MAQVGRESVAYQIVGTQQSPIVIDPGATISASYGNDYIEFDPEANLAGQYDGENFVFTKPSEGGGTWTVRAEGKTWHIRKIHMHDHVEHVVAGMADSHFDCHLVHSLADDEAAAGDKLVIGVFFKLDEKAKRRDSIYRLNEKMRANRKADGKPECVGVPGDLKPTDFLPETLKERAAWFHYMGSLTSGTFSENVHWYVIRGEIGIPPDHLDHVRQCACQTARPTQPLNRRLVLRNIFAPENQSPGTVA